MRYGGKEYGTPSCRVRWAVNSHTFLFHDTPERPPLTPHVPTVATSKARISRRSRKSGSLQGHSRTTDLNFLNCRGRRGSSRPVPLDSCPRRIPVDPALSSALLFIMVEPGPSPPGGVTLNCSSTSNTAMVGRVHDLRPRLGLMGRSLGGGQL